jgi:Zn-dependent protease
MDQLPNMMYLASIWVIPVIIAITFHEAAHGYVARLLGDDTAWRLGRVTLNPLKHIDPVGTILLPGFLLLLGSPFLFGYAKPVPVNFRALRNPRSGMVWVAAAGPAMNIALAMLAALAFHLVGYLPITAAQWVAENLKNALIINAVLAVFNMFPLPPLDGGRIAVGMLPGALASPLARLEPYGMIILIGLLFILPMLGAQLGVDLSIVSRVIATSTEAIIGAILRLTGHTSLLDLAGVQLSAGAAPKPGLAMRYAGQHRLDEIDRVDCCVIHNQILLNENHLNARIHRYAQLKCLLACCPNSPLE